MDFDFENEIKELGTCIDFTEMDEDMWVCLDDEGFDDTDEIW